MILAMFCLSEPASPLVKQARKRQTLVNMGILPPVDPTCAKADFLRGITSYASGKKQGQRSNKVVKAEIFDLITKLPPKAFNPHDIMNPESYLKFFTYSQLVYLPERRIKKFKGADYYTGGFEVVVRKEQKGYQNRLFKDLDSVYVLFKSDTDKTITVSFRGSASKSDFLADISASKTSPLGTIFFNTRECPVSRLNLSKSTFYIHKGFLESLPFRVVTEIIKDLKKAKANNPEYDIVLTGHSLGGVKVMLLALHLRLQHHKTLPVTAIFNFGMPPVGSTTFNRYMTNCIGAHKIVRVVTSDDLVPWSRSWNKVLHFGREIFNEDPNSPDFQVCLDQLDAKCSAGIECSQKSFVNHGICGGVRWDHLLALS